jgi:hypothetical protein
MGLPGLGAAGGAAAGRDWVAVGAAGAGTELGFGLGARWPVDVDAGAGDAGAGETDACVVGGELTGAEEAMGGGTGVGTPDGVVESETGGGAALTACEARTSWAAPAATTITATPASTP